MNTMKQISVRGSEPIHVLFVEGEPYFIGWQAARLAGYKDPHKAWEKFDGNKLPESFMVEHDEESHVTSPYFTDTVGLLQLFARNKNISIEDRHTQLNRLMSAVPQAAWEYELIEALLS